MLQSSCVCVCVCFGLSVFSSLLDTASSALLILDPMIIYLFMPTSASVGGNSHIQEQFQNHSTSVYSIVRCKRM